MRPLRKTSSLRTAVLAACGLLLILGGCAHMPADSHRSLPAAGPRLAADDARFRFDGRVDFANRAAPVLIWQATRVRLDFTGESIALHFAHADGQNFFDATIDGTRHLVAVAAGPRPPAASVTGLGAGRHTLELFKRNEAAAGTVAFTGVTLAPGAEAFAAAPAPDVRWMFFGDSITAGACNEDGATDQWEDRRTHNNARSFGALTAAAFPVDYRNIAISGMGIVEGYVEMRAGEIWDRLYPRADSPRADLTGWVPHVVFVNLGENDDSFTTNNHRPFPAGYSAGYVALVRSLRAAWPQAQIVLLRGGMFGGAQSLRLRPAWEAAVAELERTDPKITHFVFQHWSQMHPRVADAQAMADELAAWLRLQPFAGKKS